MIEEIKQDAKTRMAKSVEALRHELAKLRTGRASTALLEHIRVDYYGTPTPVNQLASVSVADARTLAVQPWDKSVVTLVEKAIRDSDLGLNPATAGEVIRVPLPPLTEERRKEMTKLVKGEGEGAKVAIRNIRRDANSHLKDLVKSKDIAEDEEKRAQDEVQKLTDKYTADVDQLVEAKEKDIMEI
jgi:ribosome recycling factor